MARAVISWVLAATLAWTGYAVPVQAAVISTQQALSIESRQVLIGDLEARLARTDVRQAMVDLGVDPDEARLRVASLSDVELQQLDGQLDSLPAGGGVLGLIGAVFVVLLILELVGVIDIFKRA